MKLTAIIIAKNEEQMIEECINSVHFADERILIDSESIDSTREIAKKKGVRVITKEFTNYADQRTAAIKYSHGDWLLYVDADERVSEKLQEEIQKVISDTLPGACYSAFKIPRKNYYLGNNEWPKIEYLERLFKKKDLIKWEGPVHEHAVYKGNIGMLINFLIHYTHRNLELMTTKTNQWSEVESQLLFSADHPRMNELRFLRIMVTKFFDSYITQRGWKAGVPGFIESMYQAYSYFIIYAKLWEKQKNPQKTE